MSVKNMENLKADLAKIGRLDHTIGVVDFVEKNMEKYLQNHNNIVIEAAWYHDIGYKLNDGFHPINGYNLFRNKLDDRVLFLILNHSDATSLSKILGYEKEYNEISRILRFKINTKYSTKEKLLLLKMLKLLTIADMNVNLKGEKVGFEKRLKDIEDRHGEDSQVYEHAKSLIEKLKKGEKNEYYRGNQKIKRRN
jgi:hypothetical protein